MILACSTVPACRLLLAGLMALTLTPAWSRPELHCALEVNGEVHRHVFPMVSHPYTVTSIDIGERFRFKAVVLGEALQLQPCRLLFVSGLHSCSLGAAVRRTYGCR